MIKIRISIHIEMRIFTSVNRLTLWYYLAKNDKWDMF